MADPLGKSTDEPPEDASQVVEWLDAGQDEAWRLLLVVHNRLLARLDAEMRRDHGLNLADYEILVALSGSDGALRMTELAERVLLSPSGLTRRVDRLVERGLVDRRPSAVDGRATLAALTTAGWDDLRRAAPTHVSGVRRYLLDPVTPAGVEPLASGLRAVNQALGEGTANRAANRATGRAEGARRLSPARSH